MTPSVEHDTIALFLDDLRRYAYLTRDEKTSRELYEFCARLERIAAEQRQIDAEMRDAIDVRLFDGQWVNIVNAPGQTIEGAVKATEAKMRENAARGWPPLRPEYKELRAKLAACERERDWMRRNAPLAYSQYRVIAADAREDAK